MNIRLTHLVLRARRSTEEIIFSESVTFLYGPISKGKSTVARLIDYCFGGELERTPAIQKEFVSATLGVKIGKYDCNFERGAEDTLAVRVTWTDENNIVESINAPLSASEEPLIGSEVYNLSDLIFYLSGVEPIKVLKRTRDPDSPMIRLSFRDIWWYCYLDQTHLDSSFFRLEDPFRGRKSQDAMRFFTGLHSERLSQLQKGLYRTIAEQQGAREAVSQIRAFMARFDLGSEAELNEQIEETENCLKIALDQKQTLENERETNIHPTDELRRRLRALSEDIVNLREAIGASQSAIDEQVSLRAELITAKIKASRAEQAGLVLDSVDYVHCPQCGSDVSTRPHSDEQCRLCGTPSADNDMQSSFGAEATRLELNDRIDQISDSVKRRRQAMERTKRELQRVETEKLQLDRQLQDELRRYDSAFIESIREAEREAATLQERLRSFKQLQELPRAINELEEQAGASQGRIDRLRSAIDDERNRLRSADANIRAIAEKFKAIMLDVGFPGVFEKDSVRLDPRNWKPTITHSEQEWGFWDAGSGGKKTLFNVCYALAVHEVARNRGMPVPNVLIIDSPTKNISEDENPELVQSLYDELYRFAASEKGGGTQFLLIDSDLVVPEIKLSDFKQRRIAGEPGAPSLISYYDGP